MTWPTDQIERALQHLTTADPVLKTWIERIGPFRLRPRRHHFEMLARSIISQQISTAAARSIHRRLKVQCGTGALTAPKLLRLAPTDWRAAGVSPQKQRYLRDLAHQVGSGHLRLRQLSRLSDEEIIEQLVGVKGIGVWTAQMFLIFGLGRLDVFPHADLGIRTALKTLYQLRDLPDRAEAHRIAAAWRPYATVASWYCWRSLELI